MSLKLNETGSHIQIGRNGCFAFSLKKQKKNHLAQVMVHQKCLAHTHKELVKNTLQNQPCICSSYRKGFTPILTGTHCRRYTCCRMCCHQSHSGVCIPWCRWERLAGSHGNVPAHTRKTWVSAWEQTEFPQHKEWNWKITAITNSVPPGEEWELTLFLCTAMSIPMGWMADILQPVWRSQRTSPGLHTAPPVFDVEQRTSITVLCDCNSHQIQLFVPILFHSPLLYLPHIFHSFSCQDWSAAPWRKERWTLAETLPIHNHGIRAQPHSHVVQGTISDKLAKHYLSSISKNMPSKTRDASYGIVLSQAVNPFSGSLGAVGLDKRPSQTPTMATGIGSQDPCSTRF